MSAILIWWGMKPTEAEPGTGDIDYMVEMLIASKNMDENKWVDTDMECIEELSTVEQWA